MAEARIARGPGWGILYDPSQLEEPTPEVFENPATATKGSADRVMYTVRVAGTRKRRVKPNEVLDALRGGRGGIRFFTWDGGDWAVRHYRRGGFFGRLVYDSYPWLGEERTRSFAEWRLLARLHAAGLPVPRPVAAGYRRGGLVYRADLITERIADAEPLALFCVPSRGAAPWREVGATIRRFHDAGVYHADLNAYNILVGEDASVWLLDFDRGEIRGDGPWKRANLARLERSLRKLARLDHSLRKKAGLPGGRPFNEYGWGLLEAGYETGRRASSP